MKLKVVHSSLNCKDSTCPTIYQDQESGSYVIQGFILKSEEKQNIVIPEGEDAIVLPAEFLQTFISKQKA